MSAWKHSACRQLIIAVHAGGYGKVDFIVRYTLWCNIAVVDYVSNSNSSSSSRKLQSDGIEVATKSISKMRYLESIRGSMTF